MSIRMSNEMRELRNQLKTALDNIDKAVSNGDVEAAENAKAEADKVRNLLTIAELSVLASLTREESRGSYLRPEFPEPSDDWACSLAIGGTEGSYETEKVEMPVVDWESIDWTQTA